MSSIGKFQAAIASASNETTLALANLNVDFSIIRVEAPVEFRDLGLALSSKRRSAAEHGMSHSTARRLGSLFEQAIPSTPRLFKAYGLRASEIAKSYTAHQKGNKSLGPFAEHTGVDATTIWAAATSGTSAIAVHLLACMLARIWSASEAVGIWEQILSARRKELLDFDQAGSIHLNSLAAAQLSLSREQLAEWDASARSWLRAADAVEIIRQKQVNLIVENLNVPVNRDMDVYASVIQAWTTAMVTMDKLIGGMGHSVHEGSVLLGLSSWHLYPDIVVLGNSTAETKQGDPLVGPGGIVTIGLQAIDHKNDRGVYWSLPLAHMRYYGDPIKAEGSLSLDSSRVSLDQFLLVATGSLIATWSSLSTSLTESLKLLSLMWECCEHEIMATPDLMERKLLGETSWLRILADSAELFFSAGANEQQNLKRLITLGQRRAVFFGRFKFPTTVFGITGQTLQRLLKDNESRISFLRRLAAKSRAEVDSLIIRIRVETKGSKPYYDYVTGLPQIISMPGEKPEYRFIHWTPSHIQSLEAPPTNANRHEYTVEFAEYEKDSIEAHDNLAWFNWKNPPVFFRNVPTFETHDEDQSERPSKGPSRWKLSTHTPRLNQKPKTETLARFEFLYGDLNHAAIFRRSDRMDVTPKDVRIAIKDISDAFRSKAISPRSMILHLADPWLLLDKDQSDDVSSKVQGGDELQLCLRSLATVVKVYRLLSNTTISLNIVSFGELSRAYWNKDSTHRESLTYPEALLPLEMSRPETFSLIAMFESGGFNLPPDFLDRVMAISTADSIFVAAPLLCDPSIHPEPHEVRRIVGNIGRAGLALLIPPNGPKTKVFDVESYQLVNHNPFDGKLEDCFQSTSLHLSFSGYELPMDVGEHGGKNREAFFLESLVSVHNRGEWVADLDILAAFDSPRFQCIIDQPSCLIGSPRQVPDFPAVSIDSWQELLERPLDVAVVRAQNNWLGRLAAVAVSVQLGYHTILFTGSACWSCGEKTVQAIEQEVGDEGSQDATKTVFIL